MPPKKKRRVAKNERAAERVEDTRSMKQNDLTLSTDLLGKVMAYLGPRELFRLAFTCKALLSQVDMNMVVGSAVIHGGAALNKMKIIYQLMRDESIYPPSPLRLLRLVNVRRCEHCNLVATAAIHPDFGVALCKRTCLNPRHAGSFVQQFSEVRVPYARELAKHLRVFKVYKGTRQRFYVHWTRQLRHGNEVCGPLVTVQELTEFSQNDNPVGAFEHSIPPEHLYQGFVNAFKHFVQRARREQQELEVRQRREYNDAVSSMILSIKNQLDGQWRELAMQTHENGFTFRCLAVDTILKEYVVSPRSCLPEIKQRIVAQINRLFAGLVAFQNLPFLQKQEHPFDLQLRRYCRSVMMPDMQSLAFQPFSSVEFFESLRQHEGADIRTLAGFFKDRRPCAEGSRGFKKWVNMLAAAHCALYTAHVDGGRLPEEEELYNRLCNGIQCFVADDEAMSELKEINIRRCNNQEVLLRLRDVFGFFLRNSQHGDPIMSSGATDVDRNANLLPWARNNNANDSGGPVWCPSCYAQRSVADFPKFASECNICVIASIREILGVPACCAMPRNQMHWRS